MHLNLSGEGAWAHCGLARQCSPVCFIIELDASKRIMNIRIFITIIVFQLAALSLAAQTTEFSYPDSLKDSANAANGNYDFEFRLFDAAAGGSQLGILARNGVTVSNGIFSVSLDFGSPFTGADRYLEIGG